MGSFKGVLFGFPGVAENQIMLCPMEVVTSKPGEGFARVWAY